jgi:hypothetical protein
MFRLFVLLAAMASLRLKLRRVGMRLERSGYGYRLLYGNTVLLACGPDGFGLSLSDIDLFTRGALRGV